MIIDIIQIVVNYSSIKNQICITMMAISPCIELYIYELCEDNSFPSIYNKITNEIIKQKKFSRLVKICCGKYMNINNVDHLSETLLVFHPNKAFRNHYVNLNKLVELNVERIGGTIIHRSYDTIKILYCGYNSIGNVELCKYKFIKELYCKNALFITNIGHLKNTLEVLDCSGFCGIDKNEINKLCVLNKLIK